MRITWKHGLSLIEVMVTVFLISASIVAVTPLFTQGIKTERYAEKRTTAISLAQEKIEILKGVTFASLASEGAAAVSGYSGYSRAVEVTSVSSTLKKIVVTVTWTSSLGNSQTYTLATMRADHD